jgi:hypothetical protein
LSRQVDVGYFKKVVRVSILVVILVVFVLVAGGTLLYRNYFVLWKSNSQLRRKFIVLAPLLAKLNAQETISAGEVLAIVVIPALRHALFRMLEDFGRVDLFPTEYLTREKGAESHMVIWLEYPTELGRAPDEIILLSRVLHNADTGLEYFVFKFFSGRPLWAARNGWMIGVSGPYATLARPYDPPLRVFSRFNKLGSVSDEEEVRWVHENINPNDGGGSSGQNSSTY